MSPATTIRLLPLKHPFLAGFRVDQDDLKKILELASEILEQSLLQLRPRLPCFTFYRWKF
ncbi:MAG: hypothetical protein M3082_12005 [Candidatus Dormibacteraeota bacterium]|nr:hypothetical protein [Candidatus Dormibacteraeota bacterium]